MDMLFVLTNKRKGKIKTELLPKKDKGSFKFHKTNSLKQFFMTRRKKYMIRRRKNNFPASKLKLEMILQFKLKGKSYTTNDKKGTNTKAKQKHDNPS